MTDNVLGAVLAGGTSDRMGRSKASLRVEGVSFLERTVATLARVCDEVVVCGGHESVAGASLVPDLVVGAGPLSGLAAALAYCDGRSVFVAAVDMPLITVETITRVLEPEPMRGQARIARVDGRIQPVCGAYAHDLAGLARDRLGAGDRSLMAFIKGVPHVTLVDVTDGSLRNINTPEDYEALRSCLS